MNFHILLKQSFKDFRSKAVIYLTFTIFLTLVLSLVVGLMGFNLNLSNQITTAHGKYHPNAVAAYFNYKLKEDANIPETDNYHVVIEDQKNIVDKQKNLIAYAEALINSVNHQTNKEYPKQWAKTLVALTGVFQGNLTKLDEDNMTNPIIFRHLKADTQTNSNTSTTNQPTKDEYNQLIADIKEMQYLDTNVTFGQNSQSFILNYLQWYYDWNENVGFQRTGDEHNSYSLLTGFKWMPDYFKYPTQAQKPIMMSTKILQMLDLKTLSNQEISAIKNDNTNLANQSLTQQKLFLDNHYVFVTQKTLAILQEQGKGLGDVIKLRVGNTTQWFLILGIAVSSDTLIQKEKNERYFFPWTIWNESLGFSLFNNDVMAIRFNQAKNNPQQGQAILEQQGEIFFIKAKSKDRIYYPTQGLWRALPTTLVDFSYKTFTALVLSIGVMLAILLFIVFYFITQQIILLQRKTLFFLKAMGTPTSTLTLLVTLAVVTPIMIAGSIGIFGGLFIQNMMFNGTSNAFSFIIPFWTLNWYFLAGLFGFVAIMLISFFVINFLILKGPTLTLMGIHAVKTPSIAFIKFKTVALKKIDSKVRIGISFAFQNIYKNIISLIVLSICFGVILFAFQFGRSINFTSNAFEKWNKPYKAVLQNEYLHPFHFNEENNLIPNYKIYLGEDVRNVPELREGKIDNKEEFEQAVFEHKNISKTKSEIALKIGLENRYLSKKFTNWLLTDEGSQYIKNLMDKLVSIGIPIDNIQKESVWTIYNEIKKNFITLEKQIGYSDGINVLLGSMLKPINSRSYLSLPFYIGNISRGNKIVAPSKRDLKTITHFEIEKDNIEKYQSKDENNKEFTNQLNVNISAALASWYEFGKGDFFKIEIPLLKDADGKSLKIMVHINKVIKDNPFTYEIYTTKEDLFNYITLEYKFKNDQNSQETTKMYQQVLDQLNVTSYAFDNTVYSNQIMPIGLENLTAPMYQQTGEKPIGTNIMDYTSELAPEYYKNLSASLYPFAYITKQFYIKSAPFSNIMNNFIWILILVAFAVSLIFIALILLENKEIILLMKSTGYKISEVVWYLITGYLIAAGLAPIMGGYISFMALKLCSPLFYNDLGVPLFFIWSPGFVLTAISLGIAFTIMVSISVIVFTKKQKPRDAFATL